VPVIVNAIILPLGVYWGGMGEQIDTRSSNLNFTLPLFKGSR